jgi:hypothetical protein
MDMLKSAPLTIQMRDYGNMEKVGGLGKNLPTNDEQITTAPGDLILYQGNAFVIYYAPNTWTLTRLGKIDNVTQAELKAALGTGDVTVTLSINDDTGIEVIENAKYQVYPNPASDVIKVSGEFELLTLLSESGATVTNTTAEVINVKSLPAGIYFLKIRQKNKRETVRKIIKQ